MAQNKKEEAAWIAKEKKRKAENQAYVKRAIAKAKEMAKNVSKWTLRKRRRKGRYKKGKDPNAIMTIIK